MRHFFILPGAPRACADFYDSTAVSSGKTRNNYVEQVARNLTFFSEGSTKLLDERKLFTERSRKRGVNFVSFLENKSFPVFLRNEEECLGK
jgi:hypothetical protein